MNTFAFLVLLIITLYTFGFAITLWKEKQKSGAIAVTFLSLLIMTLPFFTIFK
jgi:uncharacterized membrane protein